MMQFGLAFQLSHADQVKSPIVTKKDIKGWAYGPGVILPSARDGCGRYESESHVLLNGYRFHSLPPNPGSGPGHEVYDCTYESIASPGYLVAFVSIAALYDDVCTSPYVKKDGVCVLPPDKNKDCPCIGNPISYATGNKHQIEADYRSAVGSLEFVRYYNSERPSKYLSNFPFADNGDTYPSSATRAPGMGWQHNFHKRILFQTVAAVATVSRANGSIIPFVQNGGVWSTDADVNAKLVQNGNTWVLTTPEDDIETYDKNGRLMSIRNRAGVTQTLSYVGDGQLIESVIDSFGRQLSFAYDTEFRLQQMTAPDGGKYVYAYDANNNLVSVTYPDLKVRRYIYEDGRFPNALTGITDENGARFATWTYDSLGRAISSEHANGVDKYVVDYASPAGRNITDPLGTFWMYNLQPIFDVHKLVSIVQPAGAGSNAASSLTNYDSNGNLASKSDFNGWTTKFTFDLVRNLELKRVEAAGSAVERTITTLWHTNYRLPVEVNTPLSRTSFTHDPQGNVLTKTELAMNAGSSGMSRTWTYTYNAVGQVLTVTGPRTDIVDKTTYTYDTQGNLSTVTNAAGHLTTLSNYDANGRVGQITDPNGMVTTLTYTPRGWLKQRATNADGVTETTVYDYDNVGQMTKVTLPDNSTITYAYDDAHRLTKISDSLGNSINYTLDNMGNRTNETVTDSSGTLTRQVSRVYDALNRLKTVTGAAQ